MNSTSVPIPPNSRLLVIDDNAAIHKDFAKILSPGTTGLESSINSLEAAVFGSEAEPLTASARHFDLDSAFQGEDGIQLAKEARETGRPYAVAFVDVRMPPGLDGIETTERLWEADPFLQIVICTAYSDYSWDEISRRLGHCDNLVILKKPFDGIEVLQLAHALTEKWRLTRAARIQMDELEAMVSARTAELRAEILVRRAAEAEAHRAKTAAEDASRAKSAFLANMSHEIRTPMNAVLGMCQLLLDSNLTPEQRDLAETLNESGEVLLSLLNDVLDISKIEADRMALEQTSFSLQNLIDSAAQMFAGKAHAKGLELIAEVDPLLSTGMLVGDPVRLRQILLNLLSNAVKFTEHGEVSLHVHQAEANHQQVTVEFCVTDTGIGIEPDDLSRLFGAFIQADSSITRRFGGTGLGLAICKRLVELMGGSIEVISTPGTGSTFTLRIPFPRSSDPLPPPPPSSSIPELADKRILVVDDCATNRKLIRHLVEAWSGTIEEAATSAPVPGMLQAVLDQGRPYDAILLDYHMPLLDGLGLAAQLRDAFGSTVPPLLLLTSHADRPTRKTLDDLGIRACLFKPVRKQQLAQALVSLLGPARSTPSGTPFPLPANAEPTPQPPPPTDPNTVGSASTPSPTPSVRVLVAEDNAVNRKLALLHLKKFGFEGDVANNGFEAVRAVESNHYDLVLMDCQMPELDGLAATRQIRQHEAGTGRRVPIIALTGGTVLGVRDECFAAGMDDYIAKPVRWAELRTVVHRLLPHLRTSRTEAPTGPRTSRTPAQDPPEASRTS